MSRMKLPVFLALLLALLTFSAVGAQDEASAYETHDLLIYNVWVRPTAGELAEGATPEAPIPGTTTGAYMTLQNTSETTYQLVGIETDAAEMTHVHETTVEGEVARMRMVRAVDIPAGETVSLAPLGFHAMLMNVTHDVRPGDAVALTLTFADADGDTFDVLVAALATDFPPEETLEAANIRAQASDSWEEGAVLVVMLLNNRGEDADPIDTITTSLGGSADMMLPMPLPFLPESPLNSALDFPILVTDWREDTESVLPSAFTLTFEFASGKTLTVAVPVIGAES